MINLLVTSINWRTQILKDLCAGIKKIDPNNKIVTAEMDSLASGIYFADAHYKLPAYTQKHYLSELKKVCHSEAINFLLPQTDRDCNFFKTHRKEIESWGVVLLMPDNEVIDLLNDKKKSQEFFHSKQILVPKLYELDQIEKIKEFPVVIKPRKDSGSANVHIVYHQNQLQALLEQVSEPMIEQFVEGDEYTVDGAGNLDGTLMGLVPRKRIMVKAGISIKGATVYDKDLIALSKKVYSFLKMRGLFCMQFIKNKSQYYLVEVNGREGSGMVLSTRAGLKIEDVFQAYDHRASFSYKDDFFQKDLYMMQYLVPLIKKGTELL